MTEPPRSPLVRWARFAPGLALAVLVMLAAQPLAAAAGAWVLRAQGVSPEGRASPVSAIMVAIVLGMVIANVVRLPAILGPGLQLGIKKVLRLGIILVGIKLSFLDVVKLGAWGVPVVVVLIAAAVALTVALGRRLGVSDKLAMLAAASTSICGVTATVAVAPTIDADDREVAYTIANVTLFGLVAMFAYPWVAHALFAAAPGAAGLFLGTSIHETAQVMGAALSYNEVFQDEAAMKVATVAKLTRNVCLVGVVPAIAYVYARRQGGAAKRVPLARLFPTFVLGFLAMAIVRSIGDAGLRGGQAFGFLDASSWAAFTRAVGEKAAPWALGTAMACVGLTTRLSVFKGLGLRPLYLGALVATLVGVIALALAAVVGPRIVGV
jgi:uncharacterized integral membrane protein (TIGR00698 family)